MAGLPETFQTSLQILHWAWLIPLLPFMGFILLGLFSRFVGDRLTGVLATAVVACSWGLSLLCARAYFGEFPAGGAHPSFVVTNFPWLRFHTGLTAGAGVLIDSLSLLLLVVATTVSTLVHLYSLGYMAKDPGIRRYFTYLNLFTASMLALVVAPNILQTFVCWELVGVSSFLLIGFYYQNPAAVSASKKAFIVTRFADLGFLVGLLLLGWIGYGAMDQLPAESLQQLIASGLSQPQPLDFLVINHPKIKRLRLAQAAGD